MTALALESFTTFGDLLRYLRQRERLTQRELGQAVGYGEAQINRLESGVRLPDVGLVAAQFIAALHLEDDPHAAARLVELAAQARGEPVPASFAFTRSTRREFAEDIHLSPRKRRSNLPAQVTSFVGREGDIAELAERVKSARLLTLTGSGGCGKTRLSLEVGSRLVGATDSVAPTTRVFKDGVWLVEFAPLSDPSLVLRAIASVFDLPDVAGVPPLETLVSYLAAKHLLLILDNCEHLIEACAALAERLLRDCPGIHLLVTSRESLRIAGEVNWRVPSLLQDDSIRLFVERAQAIRPDFDLADDKAAGVKSICQQLDGIPLAIELAAARLNALSVEQISERLNDRFALLTSRNRTVIPRHQTLRATIGWSFELLPSIERDLLARLSVFAGGFTAEAAEAIFDHPDTFDLLSNLVDKSLVIAEVGGEMARYRMLETIRQFAVEQLREKGEEEMIRHRHLDYFVKLAERAEIGMRAEKFRAWISRLAKDYDNIRQALAWSHDSATCVLGLRLVGALWEFYLSQSRTYESQVWIEKLLQCASAVPAAVQAKILYGTSIWAWNSDGWEDWQRAATQARDSLALCRELGDPVGIGLSLVVLADHANHRQLDSMQAREMLEEALGLFRTTQHMWGIGFASIRMGEVLILQGEFEKANAILDESIALALPMDPLFRNDALIRKTNAAYAQGNFIRARSLVQERFAYLLECGHPQPGLETCGEIGQIALFEGNFAQAITRFEEQLTLAQAYSLKIGHPSGEVKWALVNLGLAARLQGDYRTATQRLDEAIEAIESNQRQGGHADLALVELQRGYIQLAQQDQASAFAHFRDSIRLCHSADNKARLIVTLAAIAELRLAHGDAIRSVQLCGFAEKFQRVVRVELLPAFLLDYERILSTVRAKLGDPDLATAWAKGQKMTLDEAVELALATAS